MKRTLVFALGLLMLAIAGFAGSTKKAQRQRVYMFGFGASFIDSVAYMTDLQGVEAYVMPNGFLADRSLYSLQLNNYLVSNEKHENLTCVVFFNKNKSKLEKKYQKVRKIYRASPAVTLQSVGVDKFKFEPEEYVETTVTTDSLAAPKADTPQAPQKKSSKKKK